MPDRLNDQDLALVTQLSNTPLPRLDDCDIDHFEKCLRYMRANLARRPTDDMDASLFVSAYWRKLGHRPAVVVSYLCDQALETCEWFPTIAECIKIMDGWERRDEAVIAKQIASSKAQNEHQARMEDAARLLKVGEVDQTTIDGWPAIWKRIFECRSLLALQIDGSYVQRPQPEMPPVEGDLEAVLNRLGEAFPSKRGDQP